MAANCAGVHFGSRKLRLFCTQSCLISRRSSRRRRPPPPPTFTGSAGVEIRGSASLFPSSHHRIKATQSSPPYNSIPPFLLAWHILTVRGPRSVSASVPSSNLESKHVGPSERRKVVRCPSASQSSIVHRASAPSEVMRPLVPMPRRRRLFGQVGVPCVVSGSVGGGKWSKFGLWRTTTPYD